MDMWTEKLSDYIDGELDATSVTELEQHLRECDDCRAIVGDLRLIASQAASLQVTEPARDLWSGIAAQIGAPAAADDARVISLDAHRDAQRVKTSRSITLTMPQLAAAIILIAVGGAALWNVKPSSTVRVPTTAVAQNAIVPGASNTTDANTMTRADTNAAVTTTTAPTGTTRGGPVRNVTTRNTPIATLGYDAAIEQLQNAADQNSDQLDPKTKAIIDQSMKTIDRAIADARTALAADPANAYLHRHLDRTMKQKLELLRQAAKIDRGGA